MFPKLFSIGNFFLPTYGVLITAAFLSALWLAGRLAKRSGLDVDKVTNLGMYAALAGLAGAKLLMLAADFNYYATNPGEIFSLDTLQAGGIFYGGLLLALIVGFLYMRSKGLPPGETLDAFAPSLALGQGIGRLGCFSAGCCWGEFCNRSWAVIFTNPEAHRLVGVPLGIPLYPTQLIESISGFLIFGFLLWRYGRPHRPGFMIGLYLMLAATARFLVEFIRAHDQPNPFGGPLSMAQWISLGLFLLGGLLVFRARRSLPEPVPAHHH